LSAPSIAVCKFEQKHKSQGKSHRKLGSVPAGAALLALSTLALITLALSGCRTRDFPEYPANYREFAYITNGGSNTVTVLDVVNIRLDREIQVGQNPVAVTANPKRNEVYVVNAGKAPSNGSISVIDSETNAVIATIPVHRDPQNMDVAPSGDIAYVANAGSNSVSILDLKSRREIAAVGVGEHPEEARVSPDGKSLVVPNQMGHSVSIIDARTLQVRKIIEGCPGASDVAILADSSKAFVACSAGHQIMAIALARSPETTNPSSNSGRPDALEALLNVGQAPVHLALKPDGGELFVSNADSNSISEVVTSTNDVGGAYLMGAHPVRGLVSHDNSFLFVSNSHSQELSIYAIDDGKRAGSIHVGDGPQALAFSANGYLLFVVDARSGDIAIIRTGTRSLFTLIPAGRQPNAIATKAFRTHP
jgi:YVTN family beta-propeller protein